MAQVNIAVPVERLAQIKRIAEVRGISIADTLAEFVRQEIAANRIPDDIPGIAVSASGDEVRIDAQAFSVALTRQAAGMFAERLRDISRHGGSHTLEVSEKRKAQIKRQGSGVKILNLDTGESYATAPQIAEDLAGLITRTAHP